MKNRNSLFIFMIVIFLIVSGCVTKTPLIKATESGDSGAVEELVREGANINQQDSSSYTPLMHAVWSGKIELVTVLINKGADLNKCDKKGYTPLHWALSYSYIDIAKLLIDRGADINAKDSYGNTPIHLAASNRNGEMVKYLITKGSDSMSKNNDGQTPLALANSYDYIDIVKILNPTYGESIRINIITDACIFEDALSFDDSLSVKKHMADAAKIYFEGKGYNHVDILASSVCSLSKNDSNNDLDDAHNKAIKYVIKYTAENIKIEKNNKEAYENLIVDPYLLAKLNEIKKENNASHVLILLSNGKIVSKASSIIQGVAIGVITTVLTAGLLTYSQWSVSAMQTSAALIDIEKQKILWSYSSKTKGGGFTESNYYSSGAWHDTFLYPISASIQ